MGGALAIGAVAAVIVVAAAGGGSSGGAPNGVAAKPAARIVAAASRALASARSFRMRGTSGDGAGVPVGVDLQVVAGEGVEGTVTRTGASFDMVFFGSTLYLRGSASAWRGASGLAASSLLADRWLEMSTLAPGIESIGAFSAARTKLAKAIAVAGRLTKGPITTVDGRPAVPVTESSAGVTIDVATTGPPYPLRIVKPGSQGGSFDVDRFGAVPPITPPPNAVDISQLAGGG